MSKLCKSCGNYYDGDYCDKCGYGNPNLKTKAADKYKKPTTPERFRTEEQKEQYAKWAEEEREKKGDAERAKPKNSKAAVQMLIVVAVVVVGVIVGVLIKTGAIFSSSQKDVVSDYFTAVQQGDFDKFVKCFPDEMKNDYIKERKELGYSEEDYMNALYGSFKESYGDDYTIDLDFGKSTKLEKGDYDMSEYKNKFGTVPSISEAYEMVVNVNFKGSKDSETAKLYMYVGKCSGKWKIFNITQDNGIIDKSMQIKENESKSE